MVKFLLYSFILCLSLKASAAAWQLKPGQSELITSYEHKTLTTFYTDPKTKQNAIYGTYSFDVYNIFYQKGINEDYTLGINTKWYNYTAVNSNTDGNNNQNLDDSLLLKNAPSEDFVYFNEDMNYLGDYFSNTENKPLDTKFFLQKALLSKDHSVISIQPGVKFYGSSWDKALELKFLLGHSFKLGPNYSFINIETGVSRNTYRFLEDTENNTTFILDSTLGIGISENNTLMIKNYYKYNGEKNLEESIGEVSLIYRYNQYISWQNGYSTNLNERGIYISESYITGLWLKF